MDTTKDSPSIKPSGVILSNTMPNFVDDSLPKEMLESMYLLHRNGELCDVELAVDQNCFRAHRVVLAASSMYFRAMFCRQMAESGQRRVVIQGVDADALESLIKFAYTCTLEINEENAQSLLAASNFLQMLRASEACCKFLQERLDCTNCLDVADFAEFQSCSELLEAALKFARRNFSEVSKHERFLQISYSRMKHFLSSNDLHLPDGEEVVFQALVRWSKNNPSEQQAHFAELLDLVKLPLLGQEFFAVEVAANPLVSSSEPCMRLIRQAARALYNETYPNGMSHLCRLPTQIPMKWWPRDTLRAGEVIHILGGVSEHETLGNVECYDPETDRWVVDVIPQMRYRRSGVGVAVLQGLLFAIGGYLEGKTSTDAVECYNPRIKRWMPVANMLTARMNLGVGAIRDMRDAVTGTSFNAIYAIGGYSGKAILGSAEKYDIQTDTWSEIAPMKTPRRNVGVAVIENLVYAVGGSNRDDGTRSNLNSMERYNPEKDEWEDLPPMHRSRGAASVTALNGCLYAVGGYDSGQWLCEVERFNPITNQWSLIAPMLHSRTGVAVTSVRNEVYAIGGYNGVKTVDVVERYNPDEGTWKEVAPLVFGRSVPGIAVAYLWPVQSTMKNFWEPESQL